MAIYEYECPHGHRAEKLRPIAERNDPIPCEECLDMCLDMDDPRLMFRAGIELQKKPRVISGTLQFHRNERHYTRGLS